MKPPIAKLNSPAISNSFGSKLQAGISELMRLTETKESMSFLGAIGCTRPRPLSPLFGGSSPLVPMAAGVVAMAAGVAGAGVGVGTVFWAESVAGAGVEGVAGAIEVCSVVSVCASDTSTSAAFSASALASASKQDTVASQCPLFTSLAV